MLPAPFPPLDSGHGSVQPDWRAIMAPEQAKTAEAAKLLSKLAVGVPGHWLTEEASASLKRMAVRTRDR